MKTQAEERTRLVSVLKLSHLLSFTLAVLILSLNAKAANPVQGAAPAATAVPACVDRIPGQGAVCKAADISGTVDANGLYFSCMRGGTACNAYCCFYQILSPAPAPTAIPTSTPSQGPGGPPSTPLPSPTFTPIPTPTSTPAPAPTILPSAAPAPPGAAPRALPCTNLTLACPAVTPFPVCTCGVPPAGSQCYNRSYPDSCGNPDACSGNTYAGCVSPTPSPALTPTPLPSITPSAGDCSICPGNTYPCIVTNFCTVTSTLQCESSDATGSVSCGGGQSVVTTCGPLCPGSPTPTPTPTPSGAVACGSAQGITTFATSVAAISSGQLCASGTPTSVFNFGDSRYEWFCQNGGSSSVTCYADLSCDAQCSMLSPASTAFSWVASAAACPFFKTFTGEGSCFGGNGNLASPRDPTSTNLGSTCGCCCN